jgi:UDP-2,4-diacetamido-2,4,6-trideoxy-beta-L-altropyranose hydrolase
VKVAFRADASLTIGTGHVMRCLTLADALRERGVDCVFLSRDHAGHLHQVVEARGYPLLSLGGMNPAPSQEAAAGYAHWLGVGVQADADDTRERLAGLSVDWLVVDHYSLDARWEQSLKPYCGRIMAIDDLANRDHAVDALLDQNLGKTTADYEALVPRSCTLMLGPRYALLRPAFAALRAESLSKRSQGRLQKLLVTMGGVDLEDATGQVLEALKGWGPSIYLEVTVVMGPHAPWRDKVTEQARRMPFPTEVLVNIRHMETLMHDADLAIGAAGSTSWERCCLGLPSLQLVLAENQRPIARALSQAGAALQLEREALVESLYQAMNQLTHDPALLVRMSAAAAQVTDGQGAERVAQFVKQGIKGSIKEGRRA